MYDYNNNSNNEKQVKETVPKWDQNLSVLQQSYD